jgi:hypothetical protein
MDAGGALSGRWSISDSRIRTFPGAPIWQASKRLFQFLGRCKGLLFRLWHFSDGSAHQ